jgi:hypothetical protein
MPRAAGVGRWKLGLRGVELAPAPIADPLHSPRARMCALSRWAPNGSLYGGAKSGFGAARSSHRMSIQGRDGEVSTSKTGRSALGRPSGRCRRRRRTGGLGQNPYFVHALTGRLTLNDRGVEQRIKARRATGEATRWSEWAPQPRSRCRRHPVLADLGRTDGPSGALEVPARRAAGEPVAAAAQFATRPVGPLAELARRRQQGWAQ